MFLVRVCWGFTRQYGGILSSLEILLTFRVHAGSFFIPEKKDMEEAYAEMLGCVGFSFIGESPCQFVIISVLLCTCTHTYNLPKP